MGHSDVRWKFRPKLRGVEVKKRRESRIDASVAVNGRGNDQFE